MIMKLEQLPYLINQGNHGCWRCLLSIVWTKDRAKHIREGEEI